jgi:SOS-response transcriptional repressor LexA
MEHSTKELLEAEISRRGIKQTEMATLLGITPAYLSGILSGKKKAASRYVEFSEKLGVGWQNLTSVDLPTLIPRPIPVISWVHAGQFAEPQDSWPVGVSGESEPVYCYRKVGPLSFGLRVKGDSMAPRYLEGDIIIIDPDIKCDNGNPCVVCLNGEVTFKRFWETETEIRLQPINDRYPDAIIRKDSRADFRVIGKVVDMKPNL